MPIGAAEICSLGDGDRDDRHLGPAQIVQVGLGLDGAVHRRECTEQLEAVALSDPYFIERKLYPNVDFYSGVIYRALGIPVQMFTVLFAIPRTAGWLAHYIELLEQESRIYRPRQLYVGAGEREIGRQG